MQDAQGMALWRFSESQFSRLVIGESSKSGIPDSEKVSQDAPDSSSQVLVDDLTLVLLL